MKVTTPTSPTINKFTQPLKSPTALYEDMNVPSVDATSPSTLGGFSGSLFSKMISAGEYRRTISSPF